MYTYEFIIRNEDDCERNLTITAVSYMEALGKLRSEYANWTICDSKMISANY